MFLISFLIFFAGLQLCEFTETIPDFVSVYIGSSYTVILRNEPVSPVKCYIENHLLEKYEVDVNVPGKTPINLSSNHNSKAETDIVTSYGEGECGIRVETVSKNLEKQWNMSFIDEEENLYHKMVIVQLKNMSLPNEINYVPLNTTFGVSCSAEFSRDINYCKLYNPNGDLVAIGTSSCYYHNATELGTWKCVQSYRNNIEETFIYMDFIGIETNIVDAWKYETDDYVNFGCTIINSTIFTEYCLMTRPDGKILNLNPGVATDRYSALHTNLKEHTCAMEILKPLQENERGIWTCEYFYRPTNKENYLNGTLEL